MRTTSIHRTEATLTLPHNEETRAASPTSEDTPPFAQVMKSLAREVDKGEQVVTKALQAKPGVDDSRGMIALQAGVYRYVEAVELASKLVDRTANAVKTTLQNQ